MALGPFDDGDVPFGVHFRGIVFPLKWNPLKSRNCPRCYVFNYFLLFGFLGLLALERGLIDAKRVLSCSLARKHIHLLLEGTTRKGAARLIRLAILRLAGFVT